MSIGELEAEGLATSAGRRPAVSIEPSDAAEMEEPWSNEAAKPRSTRV
jgi:hypothetical protein